MESFSSGVWPSCLVTLGQSRVTVSLIIGGSLDPDLDLVCCCCANKTQQWFFFQWEFLLLPLSGLGPVNNYITLVTVTLFWVRQTMSSGLLRPSASASASAGGGDQMTLTMRFSLIVSLQPPGPTYLILFHKLKCQSDFIFIRDLYQFLTMWFELILILCVTFWFQIDRKLN